MEDLKFLKFSAAFVVLFLTGVVLKLARPVLFPFFLALFISYIIGPALDFLTRRKVPKPLAVSALVLATFSLMYLFGALVYSSGKAFVSELPRYGAQIQALVHKLEASHLLGENWRITNLLENVNAEKIASIAMGALGPFFSFLANLFIVLVFLVFILAGRGCRGDKVNRSFHPGRAAQVNLVLENIDRQIQKYLAIKTVFCLINGVTVWLILALFGVEFAVVFGFVAFLMNYVPNIGSTIATALPVLISFFQFGSIWKSLMILGLVVGLDNIFGNFVEPRFVGKGLGLSPLVVIFSLIFWGWLWGIPGMVLSVPIAAVIKIICANVPSLRFIEVMMSK
ncbi:MAG: AI-2E family transporter [Candidatus Aminicenantales bacterium]